MSIDEQIKYLNDSIWCWLAPSKIHGVGVFAIRDIPQGQLIWRWQIPTFEIPRNRFNEIDPAIMKIIFDSHTFSEHQTRFWNPNNMIMLVTFMNHSENPNTKENIALRDIQKGEEITINYRDNCGLGIASWQREHFSFLELPSEKISNMV